ncbi:hypothetical protein FDE77_15505 [Clostridium botulinum]|nr:hypothetical protein [Clostridium botulinum]
MKSIMEFMKLYGELDRVQKEIEVRLKKGNGNYTQQDVENCMQNDEEVKILLEQVKEFCK